MHDDIAAAKNGDSQQNVKECLSQKLFRKSAPALADWREQIMQLFSPDGHVFLFAVPGIADRPGRAHSRHGNPSTHSPPHIVSAIR
jgi:hypothetical protein